MKEGCDYLKKRELVCIKKEIFKLSYNVTGPIAKNEETRERFDTIMDCLEGEYTFCKTNENSKLRQKNVAWLGTKPHSEILEPFEPDRCHS